jgi:hypothetical protein
MGLMDKAKFWKKPEEDLGDLSDLGDFGLDERPSAGHPPAGEGLEPLPGMEEHGMTGAEPGEPLHTEQVKPTQASQDMGEQYGLKPAPPEHEAGPGLPPQYPQQAVPQRGDLSDFGKDIEIIHAKLDAIRSSLDSINQRLATLERIASPETKNRYSW